MRLCVVLFMIFYCTGLASAASFSPNDIEWAAAVTAGLSKGGTVSNGEYMVKAVEFSSPVEGIKDINGNWKPETEVDPMVYLEVYKNNVLIKELIMTQQSEPYIDPDYEARISASGFNSKNAKEWIYQFYNPSATVSIQKRAKPSLEVKVTTDKTSYTSYDDQIITATVTVTNSGTAFLKNVDVNLDIGELKLRGGSISQLHQYYNRMDKSTSQSFSVILVVPELVNEKSYSLSANAQGYDVKELEYKASNNIKITTSPKPVPLRITLSKGVKDNIYLQNTAIVTISVSNGGEFDASDIYVNDTMNENFELKSNKSLKWHIPLIKAGQDWRETYSIKPISASLEGFTIPAATAQLTVKNKQYNISSNTNTVVVNGPKIILNKTVDKSTVNISEDVTVTVSVNNAGNIGTRVDVKDLLPDSVSLVSGSTSFVNSSEPDTLQGFSYIIHMNKEGEVQLPAARVNYTDIEYKGTIRSVVSSDRPVINVIDPSKIPPPLPTTGDSPSQGTEATPSQTDTQEPAPTPITPGFNIAAAAVILIISAFCRRR